ncbi:MAG: type II toxin-antitoxin system RelE/ParE family toxin [Lawsonibacter sp.]|jgi:toxin ParE1/3/4|nr:type II toxin-antitoxin system RelE/ParE family toxin [Lawsonibacter sp.]
MDQYTVQMTDEALSNMEEIYRYIADKLKSSENAIGQYNRIADEILSLHIFPARYPPVDFEPERSLGLRRMLVDNYSVFYVVHGSCVIVTNVLYSASDIVQRLKGTL